MTPGDPADVFTTGSVSTTVLDPRALGFTRRLLTPLLLLPLLYGSAGAAGCDASASSELNERAHTFTLRCRCRGITGHPCRATQQCTRDAHVHAELAGGCC
jgi:hypothetical protein